MQREYMHGVADLPGTSGSPWLAAETPERSPLVGEGEADAIVIGAGLVGALVAAELITRGMRVIILERGRIACGTTGHSTAKITAFHGTDWSTVSRVHRPSDALVEWAHRNAAAPAAFRDIVSGLGIECRHRQLDGFLCERAGTDDDALAREWQAMRRLELPVEDAEPIGHSPFGGVVALRLKDQAQFDPAAFTAGLFATLPTDRAVLYEGTAVRRLSFAGGVWRAHTDTGRASAQLVVMASLAPARDPAVLFARLFPYAHYAIETVLASDMPDGLWIQATGSELTARPIDGPDGGWILSGVSERIAMRPDERSAHSDLLADVSTELGHIAVSRYWSAEDFSTADALPLVGRAGPIEGLYYIGGFGGWGMTKSAAAASLVADDIEGIAPRSLIRLLSPNRFPAAGAWPVLMQENLLTARHLVFPSPAQQCAVAAAPPVVPAEGSPTPRCTHLGCRTKVNTVEGTIDCPCHGSRFAADGRPLYGPARRDASRKE